jgi:hypothetical protein
MAVAQITASALVSAAPERVYAILADYRPGDDRVRHAHILPKPYFVSLQVIQGGVGAGTEIRFTMKLAGRMQHFHALISEPQPGNLLVETDAERGSVTSFMVEPRRQGEASWVTITTWIPVAAGLPGKIQGWLARRTLYPIYEKELALLARAATPW